MGSSSFFQPLVMGFRVHCLLFAGIGWPQGTFSSNGVSLLALVFRRYPLHVPRAGSGVGGEACFSRDPPPGCRKRLR